MSKLPRVHTDTRTEPLILPGDVVQGPEIVDFRGDGHQVHGAEVERVPPILKRRREGGRKGCQYTSCEVAWKEIKRVRCTF